MSDNSISIDQDLLIEFIDESTDLLSSLDNLFVELENSPDDLQLVNSIFRPVHSIKGNSAFFGFNRIKSLAHEMETILDHIRKERLRAGSKQISVLLEGLDQLKQMLDNVRGGNQEISDEEPLKALVQRISQLADDNSDGEDSDLNSIQSLLKGLLQNYGPENKDLAGGLNDVILAVKTLIGGADTRNSWPYQALSIEKLLGKSENNDLDEEEITTLRTLLAELGDLARSDDTRAVIKDCLDNYDIIMGAMGFDPLLRDLLREKLFPLLEAGSFDLPEVPVAETEKSPTEAPESVTKNPSSQQPTAGNGDNKTMRVSEAHIDTFLAYVGELLVVGDMFEHLEKRMAKSDVDRKTISEFHRANETFDTLSSDLQKSIMSIRKVSVKSLMQKIPRMIRDIAKGKGKEITVEIVGDGIEVDKSLIDLLDAPLTHMVRNSADHGVETPDVRLAAGKEASGTVKVEASLTDTHVILSVSDDGAGLNLEGIRNKAESLGLIQPDQPLTEKDIIDLLFSSGVSTAEKVTDVSGRGVGMDVVKRQIMEAGGDINVYSKPGEGSKFTIKLPQSVTTQIMNGYMIRVNDQIYVLPMEKIAETAGLKREEVYSVAGSADCVKRHGRILPMARLQRILKTHVQGSIWTEEETLVTVESHGESFALCVDDVMGVQQVVHRRIEGLPMASELIAGGALMGDGTVALILDVDRLYDKLVAEEELE